jgi:hypothetical protein
MAENILILGDTTFEGFILNILVFFMFCGVRQDMVAISSETKKRIKKIACGIGHDIFTC